MIDEIKITSLSGRGSVTMKIRDYTGYWLGTVDWGQVQGQHQTYKYYNQVGENIVSTTVDSRPLSITGWMVEAGAGDLQSRCDFLNAFLSPVEDYELEYKDRKIQFRPDCSIAYGRPYLQNNNKVRRFLIQATCPYPLFTGLHDTAAPFDSTGKLFRFPTNFGQLAPLVFATLDKTYSVEINNSGGFSAGITAMLKFSGEVVNPRIKNLTTGKLIGVRRTFQRGERLEISTTPGSKHMTLWTQDGGRENLIKYRDVRTSWLQLEPGRNLLALDCDDLDQRGSMTVTVYFTKRSLEVE